MKKKEFDRKQKDSKKLIDFVACFEKRSALSPEASIADKIGKTVSGLESVLTEIDTLEGALVLRKKELSNLAKQYDKLLKDASKLKRGIDPKIKDEIKEEIKGVAKEDAGHGKKEKKEIPEPTAQVKKKEAKDKKEAEDSSKAEVELADAEPAKDKEIKKAKK